MSVSIRKNSNSNSQYTKYLNGLLLILNLLFAVYYIYLSFYGRLHFDDLNQLWRLSGSTVIDNTLRVYQTGSGRFIFYIVNAFMYKMILAGINYHLFPLLYWLFGFFMTLYVAQKTLKGINKFTLLNIVALFYNLYILTAIDFAVFFWLAAIWYYIIPAMFLLLIYIVNQKYISFFQWVLLCFLSIALGGGQEAFTPVGMVIIFINFLFYLKKYNWCLNKTFSDSRVIKLTIAIGIILACFILVVIAPGNYVRLEGSKISEGFQSPKSLAMWFMGTYKAMITFIYFIWFYIPYYLVLFTLFVYLGTKNKQLFFTYKYKILAFTSLGIYIIYLICAVLPNVFIYSGFGIQRNYTHVVYTTMFLICFQGLLYGVFFDPNIKTIKWGSLISISFLLIIMTINVRMDVPVAKKYASSFDQRMSLFQKAKEQNFKGTLYLDSVYVPEIVDVKYNVLKCIGKKKDKPILYYTSDIGSPYGTYENYVKKYLKLEFDIKQNK